METIKTIRRTGGKITLANGIYEICLALSSCDIETIGGSDGANIEIAYDLAKKLMEMIGK